MTLRKPLLIAAIIVIGLIAAWGIYHLSPSTEHTDDHHTEADGDHDDHAEETARGPHGGWLLGHDFQLEIKIFEDGIPPEFRVFGFNKQQALEPEDFDVSIQVIRLGVPVEHVKFTAKQDYQLGDQEIYEPHSFLLKVNGTFQGKTHTWEIEQLEGRITLTEKNAKAAGVITEIAGPREIIPILSFPGEIDFNRDQLTHVVPRLPGVVTAVYKKQGELVKKGELLAVIESRELTRLKGDYQAAVRRLELVQANYQRESKLWKEKKTSEQEFLTARQAFQEAEITRDTAWQQLQALGYSKKQLQAQLKNNANFTRLEIRAPIEGTIIEKHISLGEVVQADTQIFMLADISTLWVNMTIHAQFLRQIHLNQQVNVISTPLGLNTEAKINFIGARFNSATQSVSGRVEIDNKEGFWRPGLFVTVQANLTAKQVPIAVRKEAIQTFRDWNVIFARFGEQFEIRPIELGLSDGEWVEVMSGLIPNQPYATKNSYLIKADIGKAGASHDH